MVEKYRRWLMGKPGLLNAIPELVGKALVCYCAPCACHGDVLADFANRFAAGEWSPVGENSCYDGRGGI